jgi:hypothetical protein
MFDPEKVKRVVGECDFGECLDDYVVALPQDRDALLELYRDAIEHLRVQTDD